MPSLLDDRFERVCRDARQTRAILDLTEGRSITFGDLHEQYLGIRQALDRLHLGAGAAVVAITGNRPVFFPLVAACMSAGAALIPLGETTDDEAVSVITKSGARAVITDRTLPLPRTAGAARAAGMRIVALRQEGTAAYPASVVLKLTSGSTDVPKAAVAGVAHLVDDGRHVIDAMGITAADVNAACIPLSHSYALGNIVMPLLLQGTAVALRQSFNPSQFCADAAASGATVFPGVPFMFDRLRGLEVEALPASLRLLITAGARIDPATVAWFHRALRRKVHSFFGSSETGGISYDESEEIADPIDVGRAMPETSIMIRQPDAAGRGRIFVTGTAVAGAYARVYTRGAAANPDVEAVDGGGFVDGGFLTGDVGTIGADGRLVLTGRVSASINVAGRKVEPAEIERVLRDVPGVAEARVIGASCDRRGQRLVAFIVANQVLSSIDIRRRCARLLSPHKIPRQFIFLDRLPLDARGKMDRRALERLAAATPG